MERLSLHIEYLLTRHDCIVVPGFGAFIKIYHAPKFNIATKLLSAPGCELRFNPALKEDDGLLAKSLARKSEISFREASDELSRIVNGVIATIEQQGEITVGRLGIVKQQPEGNLFFTPFKTSERQAADLGLVNVPFPSLVATPKEKPTDCFDSESKAEKASGALDNRESGSMEVQVTDEKDKCVRKMNFERNYYIPINKMVAKACACFLVILFFSIFWLSPIEKGHKLEERASVVPIDKVLDSAIHTDATTDTCEKASKNLQKISDANSLNTIGKEKFNEKSLKILP